MANVLTSYVRIFRRDHQAITIDEATWLMRGLATKNGSSYSHWVRPRVAVTHDGCVEIQYGSAKVDTPLKEESGEYHHVLEKYFVWERLANEGGWEDQIAEIRRDDICIRRECLYAFDAVRISGAHLARNPVCVDLHRRFGLNTPWSECMTVEVHGFHFACNRHFDDPSSWNDDDFACQPFASPTLANETRQHGALPLWVHEFLKQADTMDARDQIHAIELLWRGRVVRQVLLEEDGPPELPGYPKYRAADGWDNCADPEYLAFVARWRNK
jgi:hypothetical protein